MHSENSSSEPIIDKDESVFGLSDDIAQQMMIALENQEPEHVLEHLDALHAADIADFITRLNSRQRLDFIDLIRHQLDPEILTYLDEDIRDAILEHLGSSYIAAVVADLDSDDAIEIIEDLEEDQQEEVLSAITAQERAVIENALSYAEETAGRVMQREVVAVPSDWTVRQALYHIADSREIPDTFYHVYVIDEAHKLMGEVSLSNLLKHEKASKIKDLLELNPISIPAAMPQKVVNQIFRRYGLVSAPVIDDHGCVIGMITLDDVVEAMEEEAEKDILHLSGVGETNTRASVLFTAYDRLRWLMITLINSFIGSLVVWQFEYTIQQKIVLSALMSIVAALGGGAGVQVVTVTIRSVTNGELKLQNASRTLIKEMTVAGINGFLLSVLFGVLTFLLFDDARLAYVLGVSITLNMVWGTFVGVMFPIILDHFKMDPAISAAPIVSTTTDIVGYTIFLGFSSWTFL